MKELRFKAILETDIILNQKAATEGNQQSLDFIPGSNFLGIVAKQYKSLEENCLTIFHSGSIRFGDAHPANNGKRTLHIPASFHYAKLEGDTRVLVYHQMPKDDNETLRAFEPKQFRSGFYLLDEPKEKTPLYLVQSEIHKSFAIKSAYDRDKRRSKESQMYGYESLRKGSQWSFSIFIDDDIKADIIENVKTNLTGLHSIGRSRTAQYGLIEIEYIKTDEYNAPSFSSLIKEGDVYALVYADARLIFLDAYGLPTLQPTASDLGFENGEIDWFNSQVRMFQYAPWNGHRKTRDTDRCGIEKGSVFYIKSCKDEPLKYNGNDFVGMYQNEGFGKIIINPEFLKTKENSQLGESNYFLNEKKPQQTNEDGKPSDTECNDPILHFLNNQKKKEDTMDLIYSNVNSFVKNNEKAFISDAFASQWGTIRSLAIQGKSNNDIIKYTNKGVAKEKWDERGRRSKLEAFMNNNAWNDETNRLAIINLASEMAKISRRK